MTNHGWTQKHHTQGNHELPRSIFGYNATSDHYARNPRPEPSPSPLPAQLNRLLLGLSLRLSYSHLLFNPTLALPVLGVGVLGVALELLSPKRLLPDADPPKLILFVADPPLTAFWKRGLPVLGENGEFEVDIPKLARGLPDSGDSEP